MVGQVRLACEKYHASGREEMDEALVILSLSLSSQEEGGGPNLDESEWKLLLVPLGVDWLPAYPRLVSPRCWRRRLALRR